MRVCEIHPRELSSDLVARWEHFRAGDPLLANPFYAPLLARAVGDVRDDFRVAVVEDPDGTPAAFLPFHRGKFGVGTLMGFPLMDHHGVIAPRDTDLHLPELVDAVGLRALRFLYAPRHQPWFDAHVFEHDTTPILRTRGHVVTSRDIRKLRKIERELGPVTFDAQVARVAPADFDQLLAWKKAQIAATGFCPMFDHDWLEPLLRSLVDGEHPEGGAIFTALRVDGKLAAAHLGLRSPSVWHWWFTAFDPSLAPYSPGLVMMLLMIDAAPRMGIEWIDFGPGREVFKQRLANDALPITRGVVSAGAAVGAVMQGHLRAATLLRQSGVRPRLRRLRHAVRRSA